MENLHPVFNITRKVLNKCQSFDYTLKLLNCFMTLLSPSKVIELILFTTLVPFETFLMANNLALSYGMCFIFKNKVLYFQNACFIFKNKAHASLVFYYSISLHYLPTYAS